jgi:thiamine-monophosphate kinase
LHGGDDYELLFCAPAARRAEIEGLAMDVPLTRIGHITARPGLLLQDADGHTTPISPRGFDHFAP